MAQKKSSGRLVRDIKRNTRRKFSTEEKIRIIIDGLRGETSIAELCRREGIAQNLYYRWSKDFLESEFDIIIDKICQSLPVFITGRKELPDTIYIQTHEVYLVGFLLPSTADVFYGRDKKILKRRGKVTFDTIKNRRNEYVNKKLNLSAWHRSDIMSNFI